jgi:hypothetical protein
MRPKPRSKRRKPEVKAKVEEKAKDKLKGLFGKPRTEHNPASAN